MFALSLPDSLGSISRPLLASISIPPLLFGNSFVELCTFPVHAFLAFFRLSPLSLVSTRIMKSSFFRLNFLNVLSLLPCCPNPFTFRDRILICEMLFLFLSFLSPFLFSVWLYISVFCVIGCDCMLVTFDVSVFFGYLESVFKFQFWF